MPNSFIVVESSENPNQFYQPIPLAMCTGMKFEKWGPFETARKFKDLAEFKKEYSIYSQFDWGKDWFPLNEVVRFRKVSIE